MERETRLVSCSLAIDVSPLFALSGKSHKQTGSALGSLAQLAKKQSLDLSSANKKKPFSGLLFISGRRGSNSRHPPWQGGILPLNYPRIFNLLNYNTCKKNFLQVFFFVFIKILFYSVYMTKNEQKYVLIVIKM